MSKQSSRLFYNGKDHKDIYYNGKYHTALYVTDNEGNPTLIWEKKKSQNDTTLQNE